MFNSMSACRTVLGDVRVLGHAALDVDHQQERHKRHQLRLHTGAGEHVRACMRACAQAWVSERVSVRASVWFAKHVRVCAQAHVRACHLALYKVNGGNVIDKIIVPAQHAGMHSGSRHPHQTFL